MKKEKEPAVSPAADADLKTVKKRRRKIHEILDGEDIKYKAPLSYRHLRIFGWLFFIIALIGTMLSIAITIDPSWGEKYKGFATVLSSASELTLPLFLFASFAIILNAKDGYKNLIIFYAVCSALYYIAFLIVYEHYAVGIIEIITRDRETAEGSAQMLFRLLSKNGYLSFNVFIDLLLCTLFTFFVNYRPKKYFQGKKLVVFRLFSLLPVIYEGVSIALKTASIAGDLLMPVYVYPLLTTKPPIMFLVFIVLSLFIKNRELIFIKRGKTTEDYERFLKTNANSLHFSVFACVTIIIAVIVDLALWFLISYLIVPSGLTGDEFSIAYNTAFYTVYGWGIGKSVVMVLVIPFIMLFSYTKTHKNSLPDKFIPLIGAGLIVLVVMEGLFQFLKMLPGILT